MQKCALALSLLGLPVTLAACGRSEPLALGPLEDASASDASASDASSLDASSPDASDLDARLIEPQPSPDVTSPPKVGLRWQRDGLTLTVSSAASAQWLFGLTRADSGEAVDLMEACIPDGDAPAQCHTVPRDGTLTLRTVGSPEQRRLSVTTTWSQASEDTLTYVLLTEDSAFGACYTFGAAPELYFNALGCQPLPLAP